MKKLIVVITTLILTSCNIKTEQNTQKEVDNKLQRQKIMNEVSHGLHKVTIDDSTTILIYRGVESATMIQIK